MKALVTGATGFVGTHLVRALEREGWRVEKFRGDIRKAADRPPFRGDAVFHLAAQSNPGLSLKNPVEAFDVNAFGTLQLLRNLRGFKGRILVVSTGELYRPARRAHPETDPLQARNPYALSKWIAEGMAAERRDLDIVIARPFNHTGPGQRETYVCPSLATQVIRNRIVRVGQLKSLRDFSDVRDVVEAYSLLIRKGKRGETYNVSSGKGRRIGEILDLMIRISGRDVRVVVDPKRVRPPDIMVGDSSKLRRDTGWKPQIPFETTLTDLLADVRRKRI